MFLNFSEDYLGSGTEKLSL